MYGRGLVRSARDARTAARRPAPPPPIGNRPARSRARIAAQQHCCAAAPACVHSRQGSSQAGARQFAVCESAAHNKHPPHTHHRLSSMQANSPQAQA
jgi:hypothetical protein